MLTKFNIKPGDLIEWVYMRNNKLVDENEIFWSSIEKRYVSIDRELVHMCISVDDETYSWLNENGLFRAHVDDTISRMTPQTTSRIIPRKCE